jgi:hypothetical protein
MSVHPIKMDSKQLQKAEEDAWITKLEFIVNTYKQTGKAPYKMSTINRVTSLTCFPVWCGVCLVWSSVWRVVCCPFQCFCNGVYYSCSNNACTDGTDQCITKYVKTVNELIKLECIPERVSSNTAARLLLIIAYLETVFATTRFDYKYNEHHYDLAEALFNVTPYYANGRLEDLRKALKTI